MAAFTNFLENALLNHVLRNSAYTPASGVFLALFTSATSDAAGGTEVSGTAYARTAVTFAAASGGVCANTGDVVFPVAGGSWGTVTHAAVFDAATVGNMLFHGPLTQSKAVGTGDTFKFLDGNYTVALD